MQVAGLGGNFQVAAQFLSGGRRLQQDNWWSVIQSDVHLVFFTVFQLIDGHYSYLVGTIGQGLGFPVGQNGGGLRLVAAGNRLKAVAGQRTILQLKLLQIIIQDRPPNG